MAVRHLYIARHGSADALGTLTDVGRRQARLLGARLASLPVTSVWHSPLDRATGTAQELVQQLAARPRMAEAPELVDHVPYVPFPAETPPSWLPFFDGYDPAAVSAEHRIALDLVARFATAPDGAQDVHEVLITHAYQVAWLLRDALGAPSRAWLGLQVPHAALTVIEHRPGVPPSIVMVNEMSHLPPELRWTGFPPGVRP